MANGSTQCANDKSRSHRNKPAIAPTSSLRLACLPTWQSPFLTALWSSLQCRCFAKLSQVSCLPWTQQLCKACVSAVISTGTNIVRSVTRTFVQLNGINPFGRRGIHGHYLTATKINRLSGAGQQKRWVGKPTHCGCPQAVEGMGQALTVLNGKLYAYHQKLNAALGIQPYYADPACNWQRGRNENSNGQLRQYISKKRRIEAAIIWTILM